MTNTRMAVPSGHVCRRMPKMARKELLESVFSLTPRWVTISYCSVAQAMPVACSMLNSRHANKIKRPIFILMVTIFIHAARYAGAGQRLRLGSVYIELSRRAADNGYGTRCKLPAYWYDSAVIGDELPKLVVSLVHSAQHLNQ